MPAAEELLRTTPIFSRLAPDDRRKIAEVATVRQFERGDIIFEQESPSDALYSIASGRVKIFKLMPNGKDVILEVFGPGDPLGAVATYVGRPFPASAAALEDTTCVVIPKADFFRLLEQHPSLVRGLLLGFTIRILELADQMGRQERGGTFIPLSLSRQELADMTGTTIETCIRIMSRWGKENIVHTEKDGFVVLDRPE